ncbi:MAG: peptidoglycan DD-metalloendopeptidase family protein [Acidobacteria bacterium]|nr:peptidoglycan DD-metalloendopeptidase family protein [Acidobacteriota bacterium]
MRHALLTLLIIALPSAHPAEAGTRHRTASRAAKAAPAGVHVVRKGETAGKIARANGLSLAELERLNPGRNLAKLSLGTRLRLAAKAAPARPTTRTPQDPGSGTVALEKGQTLYSLAKAHGLSTQELMAANPGVNPRRLRPGTVLRLPGGSDAAVAAPEVAALPAIPGDGSPEMLPSLPALPAASSPLVRAASLIPSGEPGVDPVFPFRVADPDHLDLFWPVETRSISSYWGPRMRTRVVRVKHRRKKRIRYHSRHKGIDLPAPMHTDIYAALDGVVTYAGKARGYGNLITVDHGNGVVTAYGHESVTLVKEGEVVHKGEKIAEVGRAGNATGPHLHFELRVDGVQRNPLPVLDDTEEVPGDLTAASGTVPPPASED